MKKQNRNQYTCIRLNQVEQKLLIAYMNKHGYKKKSSLIRSICIAHIKDEILKKVS